jgi:hypothetical protein
MNQLPQLVLIHSTLLQLVSPQLQQLFEALVDLPLPHLQHTP